jgi:hypothetical protein
MIVILTAAVVIGGVTIFCAVRSAEFRKFLAGAFFVSGGIQFYLYLAGVSVPLLGTNFVQTPELSRARHCSYSVFCDHVLVRVRQKAHKPPRVTRLLQSHEGEEALAWHEALRSYLGKPRLLHLRHELVRLR